MLPNRLQQLFARRRPLRQFALKLQLVCLKLCVDDLLLVDGLELLEVLVHLGLQVERVRWVLDRLVDLFWLAHLKLTACARYQL